MIVHGDSMSMEIPKDVGTVNRRCFEFEFVDCWNVDRRISFDGKIEANGIDNRE